MARESTTLRPARTDDYDRIAEVATEAWTRIFAIWLDLQRQALGQVLEVRQGQESGAAVRRFCETHPDWVWVTESGGRVVGFITFTIDQEESRGTIAWNAVDPACRSHGVGTRQVERALRVFREAGLRYADVTTNHDEGHAGARRMYEKAGFAPVLISIRYMRPLDAQAGAWHGAPFEAQSGDTGQA